jgi:hypothetical protein
MNFDDQWNSLCDVFTISDDPVVIERRKQLLIDFNASVKQFFAANEAFANSSTDQLSLLGSSLNSYCRRLHLDFSQSIDIVDDPLIVYHDFGSRIRHARQRFAAKSAHLSSLVAEALLPTKTAAASNSNKNNIIELKHISEANSAFQSALTALQNEVEENKTLPVRKTYCF